MWDCLSFIGRHRIYTDSHTHDYDQKMLRPVPNSVKVLLRHFSSSEGDFLSESKENKPKDAEGPARKRRRIILMDSDDDSGDDATFKPKKEVGSYDFFNGIVLIWDSSYLCLLF
jgi:hypothetical protein